MPITLKRAYEDASPEDGQRVLVERLWPRGLRKEALALDTWMKDIAPSTELRKWFAHEPTKWPEFQARYATELDDKTALVASLLDMIRQGSVTFVFSSRDQEHNNAVALKAYLEARLQGS